jgi:acyl-CoA synthetase (AMP-forming)/AMP-acid ligase II
LTGRADVFGDVGIVSRRADRSIHRYTYRESRERARRLAMALRGLGLQPGDRVGTLMWNHYAHFEAYFGIPLSRRRVSHPEPEAASHGYRTYRQSCG